MKSQAARASLTRGRNTGRYTDSSTTMIMSSSRATYRENALPRTDLSHLAVGRAPKARAAPRRASCVATETRSRRLPWQDVLSEQEDNPMDRHDADATRRDPPRTCTLSSPLCCFNRPARVRNVRSPVRCSFSIRLSLSLLYIPTRDSATMNDDGVVGPRSRRRVPDPRFCLLARVTKEQGKGEKEREKRQRLTTNVNRGHCGANSCFGMSQHNVVAHVVPDVIRVLRAYVSLPGSQALPRLLAALVIFHVATSRRLTCRYWFMRPATVPECIISR